MKILSFLFLLFALAGCSDSNNSTVSNSDDGLTGDLIGKIALVDHNGKPIVNNSGALVQIDGTSYSAVTDSNGDWTIHNLPSRTYSLSISKDGFVTFRDFSYAFLGGGTTRYFYRYFYYYTFYEFPAVPLKEFAQYSVTLDAVILPNMFHSDSSTGVCYCHTSSNVPPGNLGLYIICGKDSTLSADKPESFRNSYYAAFNNYTAHDSAFNVAAPIYSTSDGTSIVDGFSKGDTIYFRVYPGVGTDFYYDAIRTRAVPLGISFNGSNVLSGIMQY